MTIDHNDDDYLGDTSNGKNGCDTSDYEVGYGKPPLHSRWPKGMSGNPKGKKKGKSAGERLEDIVNKEITIRVDGKQTKVSMTEAMLMNCQNDALKGSIRQVRTYFAMCKELGVAVLNESDLDRMRRHPTQRALEEFAKIRAEISKMDPFRELLKPYRQKQNAMIVNDPEIRERLIGYWVQFLEEAANDVALEKRMAALRKDDFNDLTNAKLVKEILRRYRERHGKPLKHQK